MLTAIFDMDSRAFLAPDHTAMIGNLENTPRARLLAQAIAGIVCIFRRLAGCDDITHGVLNRELQLFAESDLRGQMMLAIEQSDLFHHCYVISQISDLIIEAVSWHDQVEVGQSTGMDAEELQNALSWASELPSDIGMPWRFNIIALM
jgi:hypothetical protein